MAAALGLLLTDTSKVLRVLSALTAGDAEHSTPITGAVERARGLIGDLGLLDEFEQVLEATGWARGLRRLVVSESTFVEDDERHGTCVVAPQTWQLHPGALDGPKTLTLADLQALIEQVANLGSAVKDMVEVVRTYERMLGAVLLDPQPCLELPGTEPTLWDEFLGPVDPSTDPSPNPLSKATARRHMDELVRNATHYRRSAAFREVVRFVAGFRQYSPFNAMLVHLQMPEARFVAPASRWAERYGRPLRPGARPLIMLQPHGPTMPVYDLSDTVTTEHSRVPDDVAQPFASRLAGAEPHLWDLLVDNAKLWGIRVVLARSGSELAGTARSVTGAGIQRVRRLQGNGKARRAVELEVRIDYDVEIQDSQDLPSRLVTLFHELAHIVCGHLGNPRHDVWTARISLGPAVEEFEAEGTAFIVARRLDPQASIPPYLAGYLSHENDIPREVSLETITKAAGQLLTWLEKPQPVPKHLRKAK